MAAENFPDITGEDVTVAVIDTGVDYSLSSMGSQFGKAYKVIDGYDFVDDSSNPMDFDGHGTEVAAVIAANEYTVGGISYQGVAPGREGCSW